MHHIKAKKKKEEISSIMTTATMMMMPITVTKTTLMIVFVFPAHYRKIKKKDVKTKMRWKQPY